MEGIIFQINVKPQTKNGHGLKKQCVDSVQVNYRGLVGDYNHYREEELNGSPDQAVLVLPLETIQELNLEGWPVLPGDLGENFTTEGVLYHDFTIGNKYRIGGAIIEILAPCPPCTYLYSLPYVGNAKGPQFLKACLNRRGWFAKVVTAGRVKRFVPISKLSYQSL